MKMKKAEVWALSRVLGPVVCVGYCGAASLFSDCARLGYGSGVYGWNWDAYDAGGVVLVTGYRDLFGVRVDNISEEFEKRAAAVRERFAFDYEDRQKALERLRADFVGACLKRVEG